MFINNKIIFQGRECSLKTPHIHPTILNFSNIIYMEIVTNETKYKEFLKQ
jgi:hypothetical protein